MSHTVINASRLRLWVPALFLLSGATGLIYEVIWFKRFAQVWGSSSASMSAVVASFLCGLGIGAHLLGRLADRVRSPLRWYGYCELGIGVLAFLIPFEISIIRTNIVGMASLASDSLTLQFGARFLVTLLIIGPVCVLMGGTLPLLVRQYTCLVESGRETTGLLYAVNTFGAAGGCYLAGFHLLPAFGSFATNNMTAAANVAIGVVAVAVGGIAKAGGGEHLRSSADSGAGPDREPLLPQRRLYEAACLTGCASLLLQIVWARQLSIIVGGSTYAFTATLFVILLGIGTGSLAFHWGLRTRRVSPYAATWIIGILVVFTLLGRSLIPAASHFVGIVKPWRADETYNALVCVGASCLLEVVPAIGMGVLFPLLIRLTHSPSGRVGRTVGNMYAINTFGSIAGATLAAPLLFPRLGTSPTLGLAAGMYLIAAVLLLPRAGITSRLVQACVLIFAVVCVGVTTREPDVRLTNYGQYIYGAISPARATTFEVLGMREGAISNVLVMRHKGDDNRTLRVNGKVDAGTRTDMRTQLGSAYLPMFLRPDSREILVIGFGSGCTAGGLLLFPETRVTCCEIEPAVIEMSPLFAGVNHSPHESPRFTAAIDDARNYLQVTDRRFDLVISEASNPWIAGVSNVFTQEFYESVRSRLSQGGLLVQWIQSYNFTISEYAMVIRTIRSVFPELALIRFSAGDTLLVASETSIEPSAQQIDAARSLVAGSPEAQEDLTRYMGSDDVRAILLQYCLLDNTDIDTLLAGQDGTSINTDVNMRLEFDAPKQLFRGGYSQQELIQPRIFAASDPAGVVRRFQDWDCSEEQLRAVRSIVNAYRYFGLSEKALHLTRFARRTAPEDPWFAVVELVLSEDDGENWEKRITELALQSPKHACEGGVMLWRQQEYARAVQLFEVLSKQQPTSSTVWTNLALNYQALELDDKARQAFEMAISIDPLHPFAVASEPRFKDPDDAVPDSSSMTGETAPAGVSTPDEREDSSTR